MDTKQTVITSAVLEVLARDQMQDENEIGGKRLSYFLELAVSTAEKDFKDAIRDWKAQHKDDKVVAVRSSEFQTLYYATQHHANLADMGYKQAVIHGREVLLGLGLRGNGKPILSQEEKDANRNKTLLRKAMAEASKVVDFGQPDAMDKLAKQRDIELAKLKAEGEAKAVANKLAKVDSLIKSVLADGEEYALEVFQRLGAALAVPTDETLAGMSEGAAMELFTKLADKLGYALNIAEETEQQQAAA